MKLKSVSTIRAALEHGINIIDTAPVYGFGRSEEIVGRAIAEARVRSGVLIATKVGLEWEDGRVFRNASRARIMREIEDSLRRLRTDYIDIYQVHWPDPLVPIEETAEAMHTLFRQGKIRAIGVSNFSVSQMDRFRRVAPLHVLQPPYNLFERGIEADLLPYCRKNKIATLWLRRSVSGPPIRTHAAGYRFRRRRSATHRPEVPRAPVRAISGRRGNGSIGSLSNASANASFTWRSAGCSIKVSPRRCGARVIPINCSRSTRRRAGRLDASAKTEIDRILRETITDPVGPEFMAPPARSVAA